MSRAAAHNQRMNETVRQPAGIPAGGEFALRVRDEAQIELGCNLRPTTSQPKRGQWTILDPFTAGQKHYDTYTVRDDSAEEQAALASRARLAAHLLASIRTPTQDAIGLAAAGQRMTVTTIAEDGTVRAIEGEGRTVGGEAVLIRKDSATEGWRIDAMNIIDCQAGYGGQDDLAERFSQAWEWAGSAPA